MATEIKKLSDVTRNSLLHKVRPGYYDQAKHLNDNYLNLGYNYRGNILRNMSSPELWANPAQIPLYSKIEGIIVFLIEQVKYIKKTFSIAHEKDSININ